ncbi:MAG: fatty acid desaturase [Ignavibacteriae bacterium]|nr:fatty acid desaturase [Ignavibacteriota bacterium]MCB9214279.1 fatty acid desaturase [Ignavibacteria bacterium]
MLRFKADYRTIAYMVATTGLLIAQWVIGYVHPVLFPLSLFMAVAVAVIAHNHNHLPTWKNRTLNTLTDYWLTLFYGFPAFAWKPTHNLNHHVLNNREGDYTITWRVTEGNHFFSLMSYPSISSFFQQTPIKGYLKHLRVKDKRSFWLAIGQYAALAIFVGVALIVDWKKALFFIIIPQQFALFSILLFNYVQHVHANEESEWNHSRNFVGPMLNLFLFNNGFHTIHHERAGIHWSLTPKEHAKIEHHIDDSLKERSFWWYMIRTYILSPVVPSFRTKSMRLERIRQEEEARRREGTSQVVKEEQVLA